MFVVSYSAANEDRSNSEVMYDNASMTDAVSLLESLLGNALTLQMMASLIKGESLRAGDLDVWLVEEVSN